MSDQMMIQNPEITINNETAIAWHDFLKTPSGIELMAVWKAAMPNLGGETFEKEALKAREVKGWQDARNFLVGLSSVRNTSSTDSAFLQGEP